MKFGIDRLIAEPALRAPLAGRRVALLAHPASVTADLTHALDALAACGDMKISAAFGPQHGLRGDKQDNMIESPDFNDPVHGIPVFSLYGEVRKPTDAMMDAFDVILVDLQDLGCRIYTFITTLRYVLEAASQHRKAVWVLDRPNPVGRPVEGLTLRAGWESFVGAGPLPMRHGLTLGELGLWFVKTLKLDVEYRIIEMQDWQPDAAPGFGWPLGERTWINPSPNAPNLWMARAYAGTVMLEGTTLSEGRGTTRPLELFGAPDIDARAVMKEMQSLAPQWLDGCRLRECWFEPTFHKHAGKLCHGVQIHTEGPDYDHQAFKPWRIQALAFKAIRRLYPDYPLWRDFAYEYEHGKLAIDVINGGPLLREWVDDASATPQDLDALARPDEQAWSGERQQHLRYGRRRRRQRVPLIAFQIIGAAVDPGCDDRQLLSESNEIGASTRNQRAALVVQAEKSRGGQRSGAQRVLQGELGQPDRIAHRRGHIQMRARQRALFRGQPSVSQLDRPANQFETVQRCPDRRHGIGDQSNSVGALRHKRGPDRNGIDMDPVDDETGRQPVFRQRRADDPRGTRTQRRHGIEQVGDAGCAIRDGLHDNGSGRLAVPDRNPHTRGSQRPDKARRNTFGRQRDQ